MKALFTTALLLSASQLSSGQVVPAATTGGADLRYSIRYSEMSQFGDTLGNSHTITPSASLTYSNGSTRFPFSMDYAGGYASSLSGTYYSTGAFQHLFLSQNLNNRGWEVAVSDDVGYRPQSPTTGFSGIPGIGESIGTGTSGPSNQSILTVNTHALENLVLGRLQHRLNFRSQMYIEASQDYLHYPDGKGLDTNAAEARAGLSIRINSRNSLTTEYAFSRFTYPSYDLAVTTDALKFGFNRAWSRSFQMRASAGPEWVMNSRSTIIPTSIRVNLEAGLNYELRRTSATLNYFRKPSGGSGYMIGSESDIVYAGFSRKFNRSIDFEVSGGYYHNSSLLSTGNTSSRFGGVQTSWRIGRNLNAFVNYTATSQNSSRQLPSNVQSGMRHALSCGIGFTKGTKSIR